MTSTTPKLNLRYPTGTDSPCDGGQQIIDLRDDIYAQLDHFDEVIARQADLPMASVAWFGGAQIVPSGGAGVVFDTVEQDDLRAADLIANANQLVLGQPGFEGCYLTGFLIKLGDFSNGVYQNMVGDMIATYSPYDQDLSSFNIFDGEVPIMCGSTLALIGGPTAMNVYHFDSPQTVTFARMWAVRIGSL